MLAFSDSFIQIFCKYYSILLVVSLDFLLFFYSKPRGTSCERCTIAVLRTTASLNNKLTLA